MRRKRVMIHEQEDRTVIGITRDVRAPISDLLHIGNLKWKLANQAETKLKPSCLAPKAAPLITFGLLEKCFDTLR